MEQQQISPEKKKVLDKVERANAELVKIVREEKEQSFTRHKVRPCFGMSSRWKVKRGHDS
ncbi:hypothetical protein [Oribacterium sp. NK2B42]|uniref:hypothetical protein n=1 Tax=Oribacterium sp. NK2B42 TaxID=689781 RepID=UPI00042691E6|nr:hypothetical protein [Oribacterium sp. NK2B42]